MAILFLRSVRGQHFSKMAAIFLSAVIASVILAACSSSSEPATEVADPIATATAAPTSAASSEAASEPAAAPADQKTSEPATPTVEPSATPTEVSPAPTDTPAVQATLAPEVKPDVDNSVVTYITVPDSAEFLIEVDGDLFVGAASSGFISRRAVPSGESIGSIRGGRDGIRDMTFDGENIWTADFTGSQIRKISPAGDDLGRFKAKSPEGITFDGSAIWVTNKDFGTVTKFALDGSELGVFDAGPFPSSISGRPDCSP